MKINKTLLTLSMAAAMSISAMAENTNKVSEDTTKIDEVTVTSNAFDAQVKYISQQQLEDEQASDMKDILKSLPSVIVDGNVRYGQRIYVRGLEDKFANITIDGAKTSGQLFHHAGDQFIDATMLKVSEVELGPNSALSGPGVVNGSFKYETKDPSDYLEEGESFGGKISLGYETARERKKGGVAVFAKANEKLEFVGIASISDDGTLTLGNGAKIANKESKLESGLAKVIFKPNDENSLKLSYNVYEDGGNRNISGEKAGSETNEEPYSSLSRNTISFKYEYMPTNNDYVDLEATIYDNKQWMNREAITQGTWNNPERDYTNSSRGYDIRNKSTFNNHELTYGTDFTQEKQEVEAKGLATDVNDPSVTRNLSRDGGEIDNFGLYIQDEMSFDALTLTLGARYDKYKLGGIYDGSFTQLSPKMKAKYQLTDNLALRAAYGRIFKGPQLSETLTLGENVVQADTSAQTGNNYEIGFDYELTDSLGADDAIVGFNAYKYNVDDYSHPTKNAALSSQGEMEIFGFETMFSYTKGDLRLNASHTYTGGDKTDTNGVTVDPITANIHVFKLGLNYKLTEELRMNYNAQFVPGNDYKRNGRNGISTVDRPGYGVHDVNFTYNPNFLKGGTFNFGVGNIFDKTYERHTAFTTIYDQTNKAYEIGRNFKFQLSYRF